MHKIKGCVAGAGLLLSSTGMLHADDSCAFEESTFVYSQRNFEILCQRMNTPGKVGELIQEADIQESGTECEGLHARKDSAKEELAACQELQALNRDLEKFRQDNPFIEASFEDTSGNGTEKPGENSDIEGKRADQPTQGLLSFIIGAHRDNMKGLRELSENQGENN